MECQYDHWSRPDNLRCDSTGWCCIVDGSRTLQLDQRVEEDDGGRAGAAQLYNIAFSLVANLRKRAHVHLRHTSFSGYGSSNHE
jgi:hypothetical protein